MAVRVLVVDDSGFFRQRVTGLMSIVHPLEVTGSTVNSSEAFEQGDRVSCSEEQAGYVIIDLPALMTDSGLIERKLCLPDIGASITQRV